MKYQTDNLIVITKSAMAHYQSPGHVATVGVKSTVVEPSKNKNLFTRAREELQGLRSKT